MKFGYTILYVSDVLATIDFYESAFGLERGMVHESEFAELNTGATRLAFARDEFVRQMLPLPFESARLSSAPARNGAKW